MTTETAAALDALGFGSLPTNPSGSEVSEAVDALAELASNGDAPERAALLDVARGARKALEERGVRDSHALVEAALEGWPASPRIPGPPEPDALPLDALPGSVRAYVHTVAGNLQVPEDLPLLLALGTVSATVAGKVEVNVRSGWREPVGIYTASILPPAARKSPAFAAMTEPVREWEAEAVQRAAPRVLAALDVVEVAEKRLEAVKREAAKGKAEPEEVEAARLELEEARAKVPPDGRLLAGDVTPEAMVQRMAAQGGRLALLEPEPGPLQLVADRYSDSARLDEFKKAWSGETLLVDRVGRPPLRVRRPALTLAVCLQPGVLESLQNGEAFRREGVLGRILWSRPPHGLGERLTGPDVPLLDAEARAVFVRIVRTLLGSEAAAQEEDGTPVPHVVNLTRDALAVLHAYEAAVERDLGDGGRFAGIRDWAGKAVGQAVRVAALLEVAGRAGDGRPLFQDPLGEEAMEGGVRILRALSSHALAVLAPVGMDDRTALLQYVLRRAQDLPEGSTLRELYEATKGKAALGTMEDLRPLVDRLAGRGCLRLQEEPRNGPGRPASPIVEIHPNFRKTIRTIRTIAPEGPSETHSANSANAFGHKRDEEKQEPPSEFWDRRPGEAEDEYVERVERRAIQTEHRYEVGES